MKTFNSTNFIKSLREGYNAIPYLQGSLAAKKLVADSIISNGCNPSEVLSTLCSTMGISSTFNDAEWKTVCETAIKNGGLMGKNLEIIKSSLKNKLSYEEMFKTAAMCCGKNPEDLKSEICLNKIGWDNVLVKFLGKKDETKVEKKSKEVAVAKEVKEEKAMMRKETKVEKKSSIKSSKKDSRSMPITLINEVTGEIKTWESYKACEVELHNDPKRGHGTVSQLVRADSDGRHICGVWKLYKKGEESKVEVKKAPTAEKTAKESKEHEVKKHTKKKAVLQIHITKTGKEKVVRTFNSITEAANATGICHSSISRCANGAKGYGNAGGFIWKADSAEAGA